MGVHKQSVSFTDKAFDFARELIETGELARAKAGRERDRAFFEAEVQCRLTLPLDRWEAVGNMDGLTTDARAHLATRAEVGGFRA